MTTKTHLARINAMQKIGCIACRKLGKFNPADVHHLLSGGHRMGDRYTIPLCPAHHRGVGHVDELHGPCLAKTPKRFRATFGTDEELLDLTDRLIGASNA